MTHKNYDSYQTRHLPETPRECDRHLLDLVERFAARDRPLIDLGCSTGNFLGLTKESSGRLGMPLVGIDISESSLELAQKNLPDIDFHLFNILEFTSDSLPISRGGGQTSSQMRISMKRSFIKQ